MGLLDDWKGDGMTEEYVRCGNCAFFQIDRNNVTVGSCLRNPPQVFFIGMGTPSNGVAGGPQPLFSSAFPTVAGTHFCGQFISRARLQQETAPEQTGKVIPITQ
jgi:hypothetical protein